MSDLTTTGTGPPPKNGPTNNNNAERSSIVIKNKRTTTTPLQQRERNNANGSKSTPMATTTATGSLKGKNSNNKMKVGSASSSSSTQKSSIPGTTGETEAQSPVTSPGSYQMENDMSQLVHEMNLEESKERPKSTLAHASFNYINSILGSGVIGMPYALHQAGVGLGLILMCVVAGLTDYSLVLMVRAGQLSGSMSYQGMMEAAFGRIGYYVLTVLQLIYPLIAMISYNIIVGDTLTKVLISFVNNSEDGSPTVHVQREAVVLGATLLVTLPLSLYRDVAKLSRVSFFSLISIGFISLSILIRLDTLNLPWTSEAWQFANTGVIQAIGIFAFAFMCHHNTFMIYGSLENCNEENWRQVTHISIGTSWIVSFIFALGGYATFTGNVQGDLLENYCWDDGLINFSRFLFCITIMLTFPLECFVVRDVLENFFFRTKQPSTKSRHFSITVLIVLLAYTISISTDCLGIVLELNGVLAAIPLAYILPALCFIRLDPSKFLSREKLPAIATALFGIIISTVGLLLLAINGSSENCSHGQLMSYCMNSNPILSLSPHSNANQRWEFITTTTAITTCVKWSSLPLPLPLPKSRDSSLPLPLPLPTSRESSLPLPLPLPVVKTSITTTTTTTTCFSKLITTITTTSTGSEDFNHYHYHYHYLFLQVHHYHYHYHYLLSQVHHYHYHYHYQLFFQKYT